MREILFRGKSIKDNEWYEGSLYETKTNYASGKTEIDYRISVFEINVGEDVWDVISVCGYDESVDPETVGQYTGLTANGTKVFEGDIFLDRSDNSIALVMFKDGCFRLEWYGMRGGGWGVLDCDPIDWYCVHDMKIIGNIHDNPELLKGETE